MLRVLFVRTIIHYSLTQKAANMKTSKIVNAKTNKTITISRVAGKIKEIIEASGATPKVVKSNFNGFGYQDESWTWTLESRDFCAIRRLVEDKASAPKKAPKTEEEKMVEWAKRLAKLTEIDFEEAMMIAEQKKEYYEDKMWEMDNRQCEHYSRERARVISRMKRENPMRRIKDVEHAYNILAASNRHNNTNYENQLSSAHEMAQWGDLDRGEVKEYARNNMSFNN